MSPSLSPWFAVRPGRFSFNFFKSAAYHGGFLQCFSRLITRLVRLRRLISVSGAVITSESRRCHDHIGRRAAITPDDGPPSGRSDRPTDDDTPCRPSLTSRSRENGISPSRLLLRKARRSDQMGGGGDQRASSDLQQNVISGTNRSPLRQGLTCQRLLSIRFPASTTENGGESRPCSSLCTGRK